MNAYLLRKRQTDLRFKRMSDAAEAESQEKKESWQPNQKFLTMLMEMGICEEWATKALLATGNSSADLAAAYVLESVDQSEYGPMGLDEAGNSDCDVYKMVFVVNMELEMGVGKIAAQVAHCSIGIHRLLLQDEGKYGEMLLEWQNFGETKIVLRGSSTKHLIDLEKQALNIGLPTYMVQDAGRTQVPKGSTTVLCIMGLIDLVNRITGELTLL